MRYFFSLLIIFLLLSLPPALLNQEKPEIQVVFELIYPDYRVNFYDDEIETIVEDTTNGMIAILKERFEFISFIKDEADNTLKISLDSKEKLDASSSQLRETGFWLSMEGANLINSLKPLYMQFRSDKKSHDVLGEVDRFVGEILIAFTKNLNAQPNLLVKELLSRIPIAEDAWFFDVPNNPCWLIPIRVDDSKIAKGSQFKILLEIPVEGLIHLDKWYETEMNRPTEKNPNIPEKYWDGKVLSVAFAPERELNQMKQGRNIKVVMIKYLMKSQKKVGGNNSDDIEKK